MSLEGLQKFFVGEIFKSNETNDINSIKTIFKNKFNFKLYLSNNFYIMKSILPLEL